MSPSILGVPSLPRDEVGQTAISPREGFFLEGKGWEYSKMSHLGVEVSSPTPKTWCKILLLPQLTVLVLLLSAEPGG